MVKTTASYDAGSATLFLHAGDQRVEVRMDDKRIIVSLYDDNCGEDAIEDDVWTWEELDRRAPKYTGRP